MNIEDQGISQEFHILNKVLEIKAYEYLRDELINTMKADMKKIATDAVKQWAETRMSIEPDFEFGDRNINISFIEHIVKTVMRDNPIKINVVQNEL
jgi:hypothetical protein